MKTVKFKDVIHYHLEKDDGWVKVTEELKEYVVSSIGRTPVKLALLPEGTSPTDSTKPSCILGGLIDKYVSNKPIHFWCRTFEPTAVVAVSLANIDEDDQITQIKASIVGLDSQVIKLTRRTTGLEQDNIKNKKSILVMDKATAHMQQTVGEMIAEVADLQVEQALFKIGIRDMVRRTIDSFKLKMMNDFKVSFKHYSSNLETTDYLVRTTMSAMSTFLKLKNKDDINNAYSKFMRNHPVYSKELDEFLTSIRDFSIYISGVKALTDNIDASSSERVALYLDTTTMFAGANDIASLESMYQEIISSPTFPMDMLDTIVNLKKVYHHLLTSKIVVDSTNNYISEIRNDLHSPIMGTSTDSTDLKKMMESI